MKRKVVIIGAGALGEQYKHFISNYSTDEVIGWIDDTLLKGSIHHDVEVLGSIDTINDYRKIFDEVAVAIGYKHLRFKKNLLANLKEKKIKLYSFIHPAAYVDVTARIGDGVFIQPFCIVDQRVNLGDGVHLGNNVVISHDSSIGDCCYFAPSVTIPGSVALGDCCYVGAGAIFKNDIRIVGDTVIGAGSLILSGINEPGTYVGNSVLRKLY